jgi:predicted ArsR family transcriptional regulator
LEIRNNVVVKFEEKAAFRLAKVLLETGSTTASVLASRLDMTPTAVRKHLDWLESEGVVAGFDQPPFGPLQKIKGPGRPARVFAVTENGRQRLNQLDEVLLDNAIDFIYAETGEAGIRKFAEQRVSTMIGAIKAKFSSDTLNEQQLADGLSAFGYMASVISGPAGRDVQLCQHNCPIAGIAKRYPVFCEIELQGFQKALQKRTTRLSTISSGSSLCTTHIHNNNQGERNDVKS